MHVHDIRQIVSSARYRSTYYDTSPYITGRSKCKRKWSEITLKKLMEIVRFTLTNLKHVITSIFYDRTKHVIINLKHVIFFLYYFPFYTSLSLFIFF
jgi:hypothetical protein